MRDVGSSKPPRRRPRSGRRTRADAETPHVPDHLPFGHHQDEADEPHNALQDAFEHFFAGLGGLFGNHGEGDDDRD
jgi:hypothetical protein